MGLGLTGAWLSVLFDQFTRSYISTNRFKKAEWIKIKI
jgi:Na+-driven multidrug efflux pump